MLVVARWKHHFSPSTHRKMYTLRTFLVLTFAACSMAAPPENTPPECAPLPMDKHVEVSKCCKMIGFQEDIQPVVGECFALVKEPAKGAEKKDGPAPALKPEGFDCMDDCIMTKLGHMTNKKLDADKILAKAKTVYTGDWATVGPAFVKKCLGQIATGEKGQCTTSGADNFSRCIFRESFLNCPAKSWTDSDTCKASKDRLQKCATATPFCMITARKAMGKQ